MRVRRGLPALGGRGTACRASSRLQLQDAALLRGWRAGWAGPMGLLEVPEHLEQLSQWVLRGWRQTWGQRREGAPREGGPTHNARKGAGVGSTYLPQGPSACGLPLGPHSVVGASPCGGGQGVRLPCPHRPQGDPSWAS